MQPNRQEQLDFITHKIARTGGGTGPGETGYYLPVMIGDVLDWIEKGQLPHSNLFYLSNLRELWKTKRESLDKQPDDCISYIYNLLSHE